MDNGYINLVWEATHDFTQSHSQLLTELKNNLLQINVFITNTDWEIILIGTTRKSLPKKNQRYPEQNWVKVKNLHVIPYVIVLVY